MIYTYPKYYSWFIYFLILALIGVSTLMLTRAAHWYQVLITLTFAAFLLGLLLLYELKLRRFSLTLSDKSIKLSTWRNSIDISYDQIKMSLVRPFRMQVVRLHFGDQKIDLDRNMLKYPELLENLRLKIPSSHGLSSHRLPFILRLSTFDAYLAGILVSTPVLLLLYFSQYAAPHFKATVFYPIVIAAFLALTILFLYMFLKTPLRFYFYETRIHIDCIVCKYDFEANALSEARIDDFGTKGRKILLKFGSKKFTIMEQRTSHLFEGLYDFICRQYRDR